MEPIGDTETSVLNQLTPRNNSEDRRINYLDHVTKVWIIQTTYFVASRTEQEQDDLGWKVGHCGYSEGDWKGENIRYAQRENMALLYVRN